MLHIIPLFFFPLAVSNLHYIFFYLFYSFILLAECCQWSYKHRNERIEEATRKLQGKNFFGGIDTRTFSLQKFQLKGLHNFIGATKREAQK